MLRELINSYKRSLVYSATYKELASLSNKELYDLGIDRSEIKSAAYEATYGKAYPNA